MKKLRYIISISVFTFIRPFFPPFFPYLVNFPVTNLPDSCNCSIMILYMLSKWSSS